MATAASTTTAVAPRELPPTLGTQVSGDVQLTKAQQGRRQGAEVGRGPSVGKVLGYIGLVGAIAMMAIPLYFIVIASLKTHGDIYSNPISWWPNPMAPENYATVMKSMNFMQYLRNSVIITLTLTAVKVTLGVLTAYAFAYLRFPGRSLLFLLVLSALMVPNQITIISNYALVANLGWRNTFQGIIVPLAGTAFGAFLMRKHFLSLPGEIMEAAEMDGSGFFRTLFKVVLPMSWPTISAFTLITVVDEWNQYLWPFLIADTDKVAPLQIGLTQLRDNEGLTYWGPVMAGTLLTTLPMIVVFLLLQKQMIKGLTSGAVKG